MHVTKSKIGAVLSELTSVDGKLTSPVQLVEKAFDGCICRCIAIDKSCQDLEVGEVRKMFSSKEPGSVIQIVGDSSRTFSDHGTRATERLIDGLLQNPMYEAILWGFTGNPKCSPYRKDVNQIVNDWIDADPSKRAPRCVACMCDHDTKLALDEWGCTCPSDPASLRNLLIVTGGARFGDEIRICDSLTDHLVVFEGGLQSLAQIVDCLGLNRRVSIVTGLREPSDAQLFSAAQLVKLLVLSPDSSLNEVLYEYLSTLPESFRSDDTMCSLSARLVHVFPTVRTNIHVL